MNSVLFESKAHEAEFCAIELIGEGFKNEAIEAWDIAEGVLPHFGVFIEAYMNSRWRLWKDMARWN